MGGHRRIGIGLQFVVCIQRARVCAYVCGAGCRQGRPYASRMLAESCAESSRALGWYFFVRECHVVSPRTVWSHIRVLVPAAGTHSSQAGAAWPAFPSVPARLQSRPGIGRSTIEQQLHSVTPSACAVRSTTADGSSPSGSQQSSGRRLSATRRHQPTRMPPTCRRWRIKHVSISTLQAEGIAVHSPLEGGWAGGTITRTIGLRGTPEPGSADLAVPTQCTKQRLWYGSREASTTVSGSSDDGCCSRNSTNATTAASGAASAGRVLHPLPRPAPSRAPARHMLTAPP